MVHSQSQKVGAWFFIFSAVHTSAERYVVDLDIQREVDGQDRKVEDYGAAAKAAQILFQEGNKVCGGTDIKTMLHAQTSASDIRTTSHESIKAFADAYIREQEDAIPLLQKKVEELRKQYKEKELAEKTTDVDQAMAEEFVMEALTKGYGSWPETVEKNIDGLKVAQDLCCGAETLKKKKEYGFKVSKAIREAEANGFTAFGEKVKSDLQSQGKKYTSNLIHSVCAEKLVSAEAAKAATCGDRKSYCPEFCVKLSKEASRLSIEVNSGAGMAGKSAADLKAELEAKEQELADAQHELEECQVSREHLVAFSMQLDKCNTIIEKNHEKLRDANELLEEAQGNLEDFEETLQEQAVALNKALKLADDTNEQVIAAKKNLADINARKFIIKTKRAVQRRKCGEAKQVMDDLYDAKVQAMEMKSLAIKLAINIHGFIEEGVLEPLRNMGLVYNKKMIEALFPEQQSTLDRFGESVQEVANKCQEDAGAIEAVKNYVDLSPVCSKLGTPDAAKAGVQAEVAKWIKQLKEKLTLALDLMLKFEEVDEDQDDMPNMAGMMGEDPLYLDYLKNWEADGLYEKLLKEMEEVMAAKKAAHEEALQALTGLADRLKENADKLVDARSRLMEVVVASNIAADRKTKLEALVAQSEQQAEQAQSNYDALKAAAAEAQRVYDTSVEDIEEIFDVGTGKKKPTYALVQMLMKAYRQHYRRLAALHGPHVKTAGPPRTGSRK